jgi:hypothetical protein
VPVKLVVNIFFSLKNDFKKVTTSEIDKNKILVIKCRDLKSPLETIGITYLQ